MSFETVKKFEKIIAAFFSAPYAVAVDSCTHGIELSLRYMKVNKIKVPVRTYISIPFLAHKLDISLEWNKEEWNDFYYLSEKVIDAAVLWEKDSYIPGTYMSLSFQYQKHLSLGRGGIILCPDIDSFNQLKKMSYDGRLPDIPWRQQNIETIGFHYYMTPETAKMGLEKFTEASAKIPRKWNYKDWPDLTKMDIFKKASFTND